LIYTGGQFPEPYRGGACIAFHGSWNRAPLSQGGYDVVFQPMADGNKSGDYVIFANGFAGAHVDPGRAAFRPTGLAMGPDGALYISDDVHGRIWRIVYKGDPTTAQIAPAPQPAFAAASATSPLPPEGMHPDAGRSPRIFHGEASNGTCSGCHGSDAGGTSVGPSLSNGIWVWGDGSLPAITQTIKTGVPRPRNYTGVMPPRGGADLSDQDVAAVAAYVWTVGHAN
jgi:mono/diheme cytochrome c family protein